MIININVQFIVNLRKKRVLAKNPKKNSMIIAVLSLGLVDLSGTPMHLHFGLT
jgi:hypothetical protein